MPKRRISAKEKAEMKRLKQIERQREKDKERAKRRNIANNRKRVKQCRSNKRNEAILTSQQ